MTAHATSTALVSIEEYFYMLEKSDVKLEYRAGKVVAMAGAQAPHNIIAGNMFGELFACLKKAGCIIVGSDQLVKIEACKRYTFPDLVIVCQKAVYEKNKNGLDALENPEVIIEVASESTELYDRTDKFKCYQTLESLKEYVLVASTKKQVEVFRRHNHNEWILHIYDENDKLVKIGNCEVSLDDIYYNVEMAIEE
jgi:Uma2 family endonuclease